MRVPRPNTPDQRAILWQQLQRFIERWWSPLLPGEGYTLDELAHAEQTHGFAIPLALREWYHLAGKRRDVAASENYLLGPLGLEAVNEYILFYLTRQQDLAWGYRYADATLADPPVFMNPAFEDDALPAAPWEAEPSCLSEFIAGIVVLDAYFSRGVHSRQARIDVGADQLHRLRVAIDELQLPPWNWPVAPTHIFGGSQAIVVYFPGHFHLNCNSAGLVGWVEDVLGHPLEQ